YHHAFDPNFRIFYAIRFRFRPIQSRFDFTPRISQANSLSIATDKPKLNKNGFTNITAVINDFQLFTCSVISGHEPFTFLWLHNGNPISESSDVKIETSDKFSLLRLASIKE